MYALANPHNCQSMFKPGQLLEAMVLDSAALLISIKQGLATNPIQTHLQHLHSHQLLPKLMDNRWSLSKDRAFLLFKGALYIPTMQTSGWMPYTPIMTITWPVTQASARQSVTFDVSSIGPDLSDSSLTMCAHARPATRASQSTISLSAHISSFQLLYILGTLSPWTS